MRIFSCWDIWDETFRAIEVNEHKGGKHEDANDAVASESGFWAKVRDE